MSDHEDYKNNPLYTDITKISSNPPNSSFSYAWNSKHERWEPDNKIRSITGIISIDDPNTYVWLSGISGALSYISGRTDDLITHRILSGVSGALSYISGKTDDLGTHRLLSGVSGALSYISGKTDDLATHRLLSGSQNLLVGISGALSYISGKTDDLATHRLLSGLSGAITDLAPDTQMTNKLLSGISGNGDLNHEILYSISGQLANSYQSIDDVEMLLSGIHDKLNYKISTKTNTLKIEEDFILLEDIPESSRFGQTSGDTYGVDRFILNDLFNTYYENGKTNPSMPEIDHPKYFIHEESIDENRDVDSIYNFHTDTRYGLRFENKSASSINSYELSDFYDLYKDGLAEKISIYNESQYPLQFHTQDDINTNQDILTLYGGSSVEISSSEASKIFIKRPHTISGFDVKYSITFKEIIDK